MNDMYTRTRLVYGDKLSKIIDATVMVVGCGGVGSYAAEALARTGVGKLILVDKDEIDVTNINRQLHALHSTVGLQKVEVMKQRLEDINPNIEIVLVNKFELDEAFELIPSCDFVIDAIQISDDKTNWRSLNSVFLVELAANETLQLGLSRVNQSMGTCTFQPCTFEMEYVTAGSFEPVTRITQ